MASAQLLTPDGAEPALLRAWSSRRGPSRLRRHDRWPAVELPGLQLVLAPAEAERRLQVQRARTRGWRLHPEGEPGWPTVPLRYRPGRRWVGRLDDATGTPRAAVKALTADAVGPVTAALRRAHAAGVPVSPLAGTDVRHGLVATRWVEGRPCSWTVSAYAADVEQLGRALAPLHTAPVDADAVLDRREAPLRRADQALRALTRLLPDDGALLDRVRRAVGAAAGSLTRPTTRPVRVHGDLHADQVLFTSGGAVLLDLDRSRPDDPLTDLASWTAADGGDLDRAEPLAAGLEAGGAPVGDLSALGLLTAVAVLQRAVEPFRHRHPHWPQETRRRLRRALELAAR
nr:aminoglycoside phosphotransferase family protein [Auraticoccus cholistanensis]